MCIIVCDVHHRVQEQLTSISNDGPFSLLLSLLFTSHSCIQKYHKPCKVSKTTNVGCDGVLFLLVVILFFLRYQSMSHCSLHITHGAGILNHIQIRRSHVKASKEAVAVPGEYATKFFPKIYDVLDEKGATTSISCEYFSRSL